MKKFEHNKVYRFISRADEDGRALNAFSASKPAALTNVCLYDDTPDDECQQWIYKETSKGNYFVCKANTALALDQFTGSSSVSGVTNYNAHLYAPSKTSYIIPKYTRDSNGNVLYVKLQLAEDTTKYLTANEGASGTAAGKDVNAAGNVYWYKSAGITPMSQDWIPIDLEEEETKPDPEPGKEVIVTGMPSCWAYTGNKEYFHPASGMIPGDFKIKNNGEDILIRIKRFYETVFKTTLTGAADSRENMDKYGYSLFGSRTVTNDRFNGTYHLGVDMTKAYGAKIYSAHSGELLRADSYYIAIYDKDKNAVYLYLHANVSSDIKNKGRYYGIPVQIKKNQLLGTQSDVGLGNKNYHLHFEVRKYRENDYVPQMPTNSLGNSVFEKYLCPYDYM